MNTKKGRTTALIMRTMVSGNFQLVGLTHIRLGAAEKAGLHDQILLLGKRLNSTTQL